VITHEIEILLFLLIALAAVGVVSKRSKIPPAILLVLTGVALALIPGLPIIRLAPELVLLLVLPPLIYSSAVAMSWKEFRFNLRPISLLAIGCVLFTTVAAAPGFFLACRLRAGRDCFTARCRGALVGRAQDGAAAANPRDSGRRGTRE
jgi:CPA1 family monovalent cation:H+ antiporter